MVREPSFEVITEDDAELGTTLLVGIADIGGASLTSVDFLVGQLDMTQIGRIETRNLPDITPITEGVPRHPVRLYNVDGSEITILFSEAFMPVWAADPLVETLAEWTVANSIEEITVLNSAPFPHSEHEHTVFYAGTDAYRERHFAQNSYEDMKPLPGGVLDGVIGELLVRGLSGHLPSVGVLVTQSHPPGPDFDAALRLLEGLESLYGIDVDEEELNRQSEEMKRHYEEMVDRLQRIQEGDQSFGSRDFPEDSMFM